MARNAFPMMPALATLAEVAKPAASLPKVLAAVQPPMLAAALINSIAAVPAGVSARVPALALAALALPALPLVAAASPLVPSSNLDLLLLLCISRINVFVCCKKKKKKKKEIKPTCIHTQSNHIF
jgi:hypothetical protein